MKRWRTTLILLGVFALLLAYVLLFEHKREPPPSPGATPSPTPSPLVDLERDEIRALHITWANSEVRIDPSPPSTNQSSLPTGGREGHPAPELRGNQDRRMRGSLDSEESGGFLTSSI